MGLFDWGKERSRLETFAAETRAAMGEFERLAAAESEALKRLGVPVPTVTPGQVEKINRKAGQVVSELPKVVYPPHLFVSYEPSQEQAGPLQEKVWRGYFITGSAEVVGNAGCELGNHGAHAVFRNFKGQWFNRHPYAVFFGLERALKESRLEARVAQPGAVEPALKPVVVDWKSRFDPLAFFADIGCLNPPSRGWVVTGPSKLFPNVVGGEVAGKAREIEMRLEGARWREREAASLLDCLLTSGALTGSDRGIVSPIMGPGLAGKEQKGTAPKVHSLCSEVCLAVVPNQETRASMSGAFWESLRGVRWPVRFEMAAAGGRVTCYVRCTPIDRELIEHQLKTHFPEFVCEERQPTVSEMSHVVEVHRPLVEASLRCLKELTLEPYRQFFSALRTGPREVMSSFEVVCVPVDEAEMKAMEEAALRKRDFGSYLTGPWRDAFRAKAPCWRAGVAVRSSDSEMVEKLHALFLRQYETAAAPWDVLKRTAEGEHGNLGHPSVLSTAELSALAHFPTSLEGCEELEIVSSKAKLPPALYAGAGAVTIGTSEARGETKTVRLPDEVRDRHVYIVGKTRTGKSTLILNMARQDIEQGKGVGVIDPHGDLVRELLQSVPAERVKDTIYVDAADRTAPVSINILRAQSEEERAALADDLVVTFRRLSESWGERMDSVLRGCVYTLTRLPGATFFDIRRLLIDAAFREKVLRQVSSPALEAFWREDFPRLPKESAAPILSRMVKFMLSDELSGMLGQAESRLNFADVLDGKKVLLVNLGGIGQESGHLLGSLLVSQLQLAVMRRARREGERPPFNLYVDEFQNFMTSGFEKILSEAGKYKLSLVMAHQFISQLDDRLRAAILGNVGTMILFTLGDSDARALRGELGVFEPEDVVNLTRFECLCRPATSGRDTFRFKTGPPASGGSDESVAKRIVEQTRANYGAVAKPAAVAPEEAVEAAEPAVMAVGEEVAPAGTAQERILSYVQLAGYLNTRQIIGLCFAGVAPAAQAPAASRALGALVEAGKLQVQRLGKEKIYSAGPCAPTEHNLGVRDVLAKILLSPGVEVRRVTFTPAYAGLTPDLLVEVAAGGVVRETLWEYDRGTETVAELVSKGARYDRLVGECAVVFVLESAERLQSVQAAIRNPRVRCVVMEEFTTLAEPVFSSVSGERSAFFF